MIVMVLNGKVKLLTVHAIGFYLPGEPVAHNYGRL